MSSQNHSRPDGSFQQLTEEQEEQQQHTEEILIDKTQIDFSEDDEAQVEDDLLANEQYGALDEAQEGDFMDEEMDSLMADELAPLGDMSDDEEGAEDDHKYDENIIDNATNTIHLHKDSVFSITRDKSSNLLVSGGGDDCAVLYNLDTREIIFRFGNFGDSIIKVQFSPKYVSPEGGYQQFLAIACMDGLIRIFDIQTIIALKEKTQTMGEDSEYPELYCEFNTEQDLDTFIFHPTIPLISAGCADGQVWLFDLSSQTSKIFFGHNDSITTLFFTNDGKSLVSASQDGQIIVNNIDNTTKKDVVKYERIGTQSQAIISVAQHPQNTAMCIGTINGTLATGQVDHYKCQINKEQAHSDSIECVKFFNINKSTVWVYTSSVDGTLTAWDYISMSPRYTITLPYAITTFVFHPSLPILIVGSHDGILRLFDVTNGTPIHELTGHQDAILDLIVDDMDVFTSSDDRSIKHWDLNLLPSAALQVIMDKKQELQSQQQLAAQKGRPLAVTRPPVSRPVMQKPKPQ